MVVFIIIFCIIIACIVYGIVQMCRIPKEETERRKPYKILTIISSVIAGIIVFFVVALMFLAMMIVTHM